MIEQLIAFFIIYAVTMWGIAPLFIMYPDTSYEEAVKIAHAILALFAVALIVIAAFIWAISIVLRG